MKRSRCALLLAGVLVAPLAAAQNVKVAPLGSQTGELCDRDRATLLEVASQVNQGATTGGKRRPESRTAAFMNLVKRRRVYLALSGKTMEFDGNPKCVSGC